MARAWLGEAGKILLDGRLWYPLFQCRPYSQFNDHNQQETSMVHVRAFEWTSCVVNLKTRRISMVVNALWQSLLGVLHTTRHGAGTSAAQSELGLGQVHNHWATRQQLKVKRKLPVNALYKLLCIWIACISILIGSVLLIKTHQPQRKERGHLNKQTKRPL